MHACYAWDLLNVILCLMTLYDGATVFRDKMPNWWDPRVMQTNNFTNSYKIGDFLLILTEISI